MSAVLQPWFWLVFVPACFALNCAPGPSNIVALSHGARYGLAVTVVAGVGRVVGFTGLLALTGVGLGALLATSAQLLGVLKIAGALYLIWLSWCLLTAPAVKTALFEGGAAGPTPWAQLIRREFLVSISNPKAILIFTAFLLPFATRGQDFMGTFIAMGIAFLVLEMIALALYAMVGAVVGRRSGRVLDWINRGSGGILMLFGLSLLVDGMQQAEGGAAPAARPALAPVPAAATVPA